MKPGDRFAQEGSGVVRKGRLTIRHWVVVQFEKGKRSFPGMQGALPLAGDWGGAPEAKTVSARRASIRVARRCHRIKLGARHKQHLAALLTMESEANPPSALALTSVPKKRFALFGRARRAHELVSTCGFRSETPLP